MYNKAILPYRRYFTWRGLQKKKKTFWITEVEDGKNSC